MVKDIVNVFHHTKNQVRGLCVGRDINFNFWFYNVAGYCKDPIFLNIFLKISCIVFEKSLKNVLKIRKIFSKLFKISEISETFLYLIFFHDLETHNKINNINENTWKS